MCVCVCFRVCALLGTYGSAVSQVRQQISKAGQPRYNSSRASSFSLCDSHERCSPVFMCACACHPRISQQLEPGREVQHFPSFCCAIYCYCYRVPVSHRTYMTLWQLWYNSSRTSSSCFCDCYERCFSVGACVPMYACLPEDKHKHSYPRFLLPVHAGLRGTLQAARETTVRGSSLAGFHDMFCAGFGGRGKPQDGIYLQRDFTGHFSYDRQQRDATAITIVLLPVDPH